jgi:hypothetical protein
MANHSPTPSPKTQFANGHEPTNGGARKSPYQQAVELQRVIYNAATAKRVKPAALSSLARAWCDLEERKRILKMKFRPGDLRAADLDPAKADWIARRFRKANKRHLSYLPKDIFVDAEEVPAKPEPKKLPAPDPAAGNGTGAAARPQGSF